MLHNLTDEEKSRIQAAKKEANKILAYRKKQLTERIIKLRKKSDPSVVINSPNFRRLVNERDAIQIISGSPVRLVVDGRSIVIDYELLHKLVRKLTGWDVWFRIPADRYLHVEYARWPNSRGTLELYELPEYQLDLLGDLPVVEVEVRNEL